MTETDISQILEVLSLEEKVSLLLGEDHWHIRAIPKTDLKSVVLSDGPNGLRKEITSKKAHFMRPSVKAVCYPSLALLGSSFNKDLLFEVGKMIGKEARHQGVDILLAPGVNLKRNPLCGRNFEYFSEDPHLSSEMAINYINGVESVGVGATLKHYLLNNKETDRMVSNSVVDDRTLNEVYLNHFKKIIRTSKPKALMTSYNLVNGSYVCESNLLKKEIREDLNYDGLVMTDWQAMNHRINSYQYGLDLEMPGGFKTNTILRAVKHNLLSEDIIDEAVSRIIKTSIWVNDQNQINHFNVDEARTLAKMAAIDSFVLLKNNGILPYKKDNNIALIGQLAKKPRYQGSGSSKVNPIEVVSLYDQLIKYGRRFEYAEGYLNNSDVIEDNLIEEALTKAKNKDLIIVVLGTYEKDESEGFDRTNINLPLNQLALMERLVKENKRICCVIEAGSTVLLPFEPNVDAIILSYFSGEVGDEALYEVISGKYSPSGRLQESLIKDINDLESTKHFNQGKNDLYKEGIYIGYKDLDKKDRLPHYPFGFGLSYAKFNYVYHTYQNKEDRIIFNVNVTNESQIDSKEVIQVYMSKKDSHIYREPYRLVGFTKEMVIKGKNKEFQIEVLKADLMCYHEKLKKMAIEEGTYEFHLGTSSKSFFKTVSISLTGISFLGNKDTYDYDMDLKTYQTYFDGPISLLKEVNYFTVNHTFKDIKHTIIGKMLIILAKKRIRKMTNDEITIHMMERSMISLPLRSLESSTNGLLNGKRIEGIVMILNKNRLKGLMKLIKG